MLNNIDLNRLRVFHLIYNCNSIVGAAEALNVTRSAVSQSLKKLEEELGSPLFSRVHKQLVPTGEADRLYRVLTPLIAALEKEITSIRQGQNEPVGLVRVGAPIEFGQNYFPAIIAEFRRHYPLVTFSLSFGDSEKLIEMVREGAIDFALVDLFLIEGNYLAESAVTTTTPLINEEIILVCSKQYYEEEMKRDVTFETLTKCDFIDYNLSRLTLKAWFRQHFGKSTFSPNVVFTVDSVRAVKSAVKNSTGLGIVPSHVVYHEISNGEVVQIKTSKQEIVNSIAVLQLLDKIPNLAEKKFLHFLTKKVSEEPALKNFSFLPSD